MRSVLLAAVIIATPTVALASSYKICQGEFALCAASSATPTGKNIQVNTADGKVPFPEAVAVCPVLRGNAVADVAGGNMDGDCRAPGKNQVWSLFSPRQHFPQAPDWKPVKAQFRTFLTGEGTAGMSNMFSFACTLEPKRVNGVRLAKCYGPVHESVAGKPVPDGTTVVTQAPVGATYPVGGPIPQ